MFEEYCVIMTTCSSRDTARKIARSLVETKLAACVQLSDIESFYAWKGHVENDAEVRLMIKTRTELYEAVESAILAMHEYEVPQILCLPVSGGFEAYLQWMDREVSDL